MAQEKISSVKLWVFCLLLDNDDVCGIILCVDFIIAICYYQDLYVEDDISLRRGVCHTGYEYINNCCVASLKYIRAEQVPCSFITLPDKYICVYISYSTDRYNSQMNKQVAGYVCLMAYNPSLPVHVYLIEK